MSFKIKGIYERTSLYDNFELNNKGVFNIKIDLVDPLLKFRIYGYKYQYDDIVYLYGDYIELRNKQFKIIYDIKGERHIIIKYIDGNLTVEVYKYNLQDVNIYCEDLTFTNTEFNEDYWNGIITNTFPKIEKYPTIKKDDTDIINML